jgi:hypothetical protein
MLPMTSPKPSLACGDAVRLSATGRVNSRKPDRKGIVVGVSGTRVRVLWSGLAAPQIVHWTMVEAVALEREPGADA